MKFDTIHKAQEHFLSYQHFDGEDNTDYWLSYEPKPKIGEWMLFQHIRHNSSNEFGMEWEISRPILGLIVGHTVWDQALVLEYIEEWRAFHWWNEYKNGDYYQAIAERGKEVKHIQFWTDHINVLGHWPVKPSFSQLKKAYKTKGQVVNGNLTFFN